jgi:hypothetical protein
VLKEMKVIAEQTDPLKQTHEKGKSYFPTSSQTGNDFIRLILELIKYWASKFPTTTKKESTNYKKFYDDLVDKRVTFPQDYKFLTFANKKGDEGVYESGRAKIGQAEVTANPKVQPNQTGRSTSSKLYHIKNRRSTVCTIASWTSSKFSNRKSLFLSQKSDQPTQ